MEWEGKGKGRTVDETLPSDGRAWLLEVDCGTDGISAGVVKERNVDAPRIKMCKSSFDSSA